MENHNLHNMVCYRWNPPTLCSCMYFGLPTSLSYSHCQRKIGGTHAQDTFCYRQGGTENVSNETESKRFTDMRVLDPGQSEKEGLKREYGTWSISAATTSE
ncbi:hypothetical protein Ocin01_08992 [Orchesella cincta]|uniref:Uncharacterized protein n=1 Tax=Orchesella cincta TaxID=48709 RepID=A0A1D2MXC3_ORCCI|nr:hypothetical protein Ocin01_08992 [Orchesella cincta]